jgi:hypothetical protein
VGVFEAGGTRVADEEMGNLLAHIKNFKIWNRVHDSLSSEEDILNEHRLISRTMVKEVGEILDISYKKLEETSKAWCPPKVNG